MSPIISVIVPVYNVEKYLSTCLDSLLNQGLSTDDYEIILVNDGSKDGSLAICERYGNNHSNIDIYSQDNQGVSMVRNLGLSKAKGEWVMFVDSDDFVCKNSLRYLLDNYCSDKFDGIRFWTRIKSDAAIDKEMSCEGEVKFTGMGYDFIEKYGLETFCYTTLYRRSFLLDNHIEFSPFKIGEDFLFASQFLLANPRVCSTSSIVYQYLIHPGSASTSRDKVHARRCAYDHLEVNKILIKRLNNDNVKDSAPKVYEKCIETIQSKVPLIFSRLLSSDINKEAFSEIVENQYAIGIIPLTNIGCSKKLKLASFAINTLCRYPLFYSLVRFLYSTFFVPYILPLLDRNK